MSEEIKWRGIAKLIEESGEVNQLLGKLMAYPEGTCPTGTNLVEELEKELGDLIAATINFIELNNQLSESTIEARADHKLEIFKQWEMAGIR